MELKNVDIEAIVDSKIESIIGSKKVKVEDKDLRATFLEILNNVILAKNIHREILMGNYHGAIELVDELLFDNLELLNKQIDLKGFLDTVRAIAGGEHIESIDIK